MAAVARELLGGHQVGQGAEKLLVEISQGPAVVLEHRGRAEDLQPGGHHALRGHRLGDGPGEQLDLGIPRGVHVAQVQHRDVRALTVSERAHDTLSLGLPLLVLIEPRGGDGHEQAQGLLARVTTRRQRFLDHGPCGGLGLWVVRRRGAGLLRLVVYRLHGGLVAAGLGVALDPDLVGGQNAVHNGGGVGLGVHQADVGQLLFGQVAERVELDLPLFRGLAAVCVVEHLHQLPHGRDVAILLPVGDGLIPERLPAGPVGVEATRGLAKKQRKGGASVQGELLHARL